MSLVLISNRHGRKVFISQEDLQKKLMRRAHDRAPAFHGRCKPGTDWGHEVRVLRPKGYEDALSQFHAIESAGKMTPEIAANGKTILAGLKEAKDAGCQENVDYYWTGHPQFELPPVDVPIIEE